MNNKVNDVFGKISLLLYIGLVCLDPIFEIYNIEVPIGLVTYSAGVVLFLLTLRSSISYSAFFVKVTALIFAIYINIFILVQGAYAYGDAYILIRWLSFFGIGYYITRHFSYYTHDFGKGGVIYMLFMLFMLWVEGGRSIFRYSDAINYLRISESIALAGLTFIVMSKRFILSVVTFLLCLSCLWLTISRASFFFFAVSSLIILYFKTDRRVIYSIVTIFSILVSVVLAQNYYLSVGNVHDYKIMRIIFDYGIDTSIQLRLKSLREALSSMDNILTGSYGWQVNSLGEFGLYSHNILSFCFQFGAFALVLALFFIVYPYKIFLIRTNFQSKAFLFLVGVLVFISLNVVFAKSYRYDFIMLPLGSYIYLSRFTYQNL